MAETRSTMLELGTQLPHFRLPNVDGRMISDTDFASANALLIVFSCNHCPFVKHIREAFVKFAKEYQARGLAVVAINANDAEAYPADSPEAMKQEATAAGFTFPYLYDESQDVAREFLAACTPDFFLFDKDRCLRYRGEFDDSRPGNNIPVTGSELRAAADGVLSGRGPQAVQKPSVGCSLKWKRRPRNL
jgi:peroxiredoxin